jgi:hypothetical protein
MKALALIFLLLLVSGCVNKPPAQQPEVPSTPQETLGDRGSGLVAMPSGNTTDQSLVGEEVDLGSII